MVEFPRWKNIGLKNLIFPGRSEKSFQFLLITKRPIDGENARRNNINGKMPKGMWSLKAKKIKAASFQMLGRVGWSKRSNRLKRPFRTWTQLSRVVVGSYQWRLYHLAGFVAPLTTTHLTDRLVYLISHACRYAFPVGKKAGISSHLCFGLQASGLLLDFVPEQNTWGFTIA